MTPFKKPRLFLPMLAGLMAVLPATLPLKAQSAASLAGSVKDTTGAAVAGASITVTNSETGAVRETTSDGAGRYEVASLPVGQYQVRGAKSGFADELRTGINLVVGQAATVDLELKVGQAAQAVTVEGDAPLVDATTSDISGLVNGQQITELPLNGRSFDQLMTLDPGVVNFSAAKIGGVGVSNSTNGNNFSVDGNRPQQNEYLLNGVEFTGAAENNMQPGGVSGELLGVDAVEEFNLLRDTYSVEYGKHPGGQVLIVTRSGGNELHGSLYEFLRNNDMDARNFFNGPSAPGFQRNQFGASLGGPIKKNKTFIFGNWEQLNQHLHQAGVDLVPDNNARAGYLPCALITPAPTCPASGVAFVGVSPLINAWPVPTPGAPDFGGIAEAFNNPLQTIRDDFGTMRLDHVFSPKDWLSGVYTIDNSSSFTPTSTNSYMADAATLREQVASLSHTHVFSPTVVNTATFGYSRGGYFFTGEPTPGTPAASLPGFLSGDPVGALNVGGSASSNPAAVIGLAGANNGSNLRVARNIYTYQDGVSVTKGVHQLSFGVWFQRLESNELLALSQYGQDTFSSLQTFLQGVGTLVYDPTPTPLGWRSTYGAFYAQDTMRLSPKLTVTLGYREEFDTGWNEAHGRASNYEYTNGVINATPTIGSSVFSVNNAKFLPQPRLGLAWAPVGGPHKTVIRAGFGMYNDLQDALGYRTDQNAPFNPTYSLANENVTSFPLSQSAPIPAAAKLVPGGVQPNFYTPTLISWSLRVEHEITKNTALTVAYIGSHGYHELVGVDANEPFPVICPASPCPAVYPGSFPAPYAGSPIPAGTYYNPTSTKPTPSLGPTWTYFSEADSSYNALQIDVNHRFEHGFLVRGVYTWSKALDDGDSPNPTTSGNEPAVVSNPFDLKTDWGLANFNVKNAASINFLYELPKWKNRLAGGWSIGSIITLQGGLPFTPQLSYNPSNSGDTKNPVRPMVNPNFTGNVIIGSPNEWFNPAAFLAPPNNSGYWGNLGRDTLIGPGLATWDFDVHKDTRLSEKTDLQFRAEFFNILNHANFNTPNPVVFTPALSPTAGVITSTSTTSRQVQLSLKLRW